MSSMPMTEQPQGNNNQGYVADGQYMMKPAGPAQCPPGLEYLTQIDQLVVKQQTELLEAFTSIETNNRYKIFNTMGQEVYVAAEKTNICMRMCCGSRRGFTIHIKDNQKNEVMKVIRDFKCCAVGCCWFACCDCCAFEIKVESATGELLGYVRQECSCWKPHYSVRNAEHEEVGRIWGPCCTCSCPCRGDIDFPVMSPDGDNEIGKIAKQWTGAVKEIFTDADTFSVSFPMDMDVRMKATMLGCLFLIDFMYFEHRDTDK